MPLYCCSAAHDSRRETTEKRPFVLHMFLADDTVEILEVATPNSGRDPFPALLKRIKLPKSASARGGSR